MTKISLTRILELCSKSGEGQDPLEKEKNAWEFIKGADPQTVEAMAREILRLREALTPVAACFNCGGCRDAARQALEKSREVFE